MSPFEPIAVASTTSERTTSPQLTAVREIAAAVIYQALRDLSSKLYRESAQQFLLGEGGHLQWRDHLCQLCECESIISRAETMIRAGVKFDLTNRASHHSLRHQNYPDKPQTDST